MAEIRKQPQQQRAASTVKTQTTAAKKTVSEMPVLFTKDNYLWMIIGGVIVLLGMLLMSGGKNENPDTFDPNVVYSFTRITLAPILIVGGLMVEIYAIFRKPKQQANV